MPREPKELFCCGELHKSGNYHRLKVHQQYTKIHFYGFPEASFTLRRNPKTQMFHCPECDKMMPIANLIRQHVHQKCEGYLKYRHRSSATKVNVAPAPEKPEDDVDLGALGSALSQPKTEEGDIGQGSGDVDTGMDIDPFVDSVQEEREASTCIAPFGQIEAASASSSQHERIVTPEHMSSTTPDASPCAPEEPHFTTPLLRPAMWSPLSVPTRTPLGPNLALLASTPSLTASLSSRASTSSFRSIIEHRYYGPPNVALKAEPDQGPQQDSHDSLPFVSLARFARPQRTAAQVFLEGLRRPLGHAAPHLHSLGIVTSADLDLACTMPETWNELGSILRGKGVTMIEWLMVKEAFKARGGRDMS